MSDSDNRIVILIMLLAISFRLAILPWSQTVHADAVTRIFLSADWLANPHYISHGYWGPLHVYFTAFSLWLFPDQVTAPKLLNILFVTFSVPPLYWFTRNVFKNRLGAIFVALTYVLCPVVVRNSFLGLAEVIYALFVLLSMHYLEKSFQTKHINSYVVLAGISITLAAATRYEAWVLIAVFTLVCFLRGSWKSTGLFWGFAMIFPISWMIGNQMVFGDFLYSVSQNDVWNLSKEGLNDSLTEVALMERLVYFPLAYILNVNPLGFVLGAIALVLALTNKQISRAQLIWLLPFVVVVAVFLQKAYEGTFMLQLRFIITWVILFLPFSALLFAEFRLHRAKTALMALSVTTLIPLSFFWGFLQPEKLFGKTILGEALEIVVLREAREFEAIPLLHDSNVEKMATHINGERKTSEGLILDSFGWDKAYYVALKSSLRPHIIDNSKRGEIDSSALEEYIETHPQGLVVLSRIGKLNNRGTFADARFCLAKIKICLELSETFDSPGEKVFRYKAVKPTSGFSYESQIPTPIFPSLNEQELMELKIRRDKVWLNKIRRSAFWAGESVDAEIRKTVLYVLHHQDASI